LTRFGLSSAVLLAIALAVSGCIPEVRGKTADSPQKAAMQTAAPAPVPEPPPTRTVSDILSRGVVITISLSSQQMHVFRDGTLWQSSPVSTGRRKKETPQGVFAILQKKTFHRSNLYSNAPMPFMQRLTWDGIAIHAGHLPGYPASHGCIRVPKAFASELFKITSHTTTAVIIVDEPLATETEALALARQSDALVPIEPELLRRERTLLAGQPKQPVAPKPPVLPKPTVKADAPPLVAKIAPPPAPPAPQAPAFKPAAGHQTIQLAAALSPGAAAAQWETLAGRQPRLRAMQMAVIPAVVNGTQYFRLRASAPDAHATCSALKREGIACFPVS
jgi:hypothetical protein